MKQIVINNRAISDVQKGKKWYDKQQETLDVKLAGYIFKCFDDILNNPVGYASKYKYTREKSIK